MSAPISPWKLGLLGRHGLLHRRRHDRRGRRRAPGLEGAVRPVPDRGWRGFRGPHAGTGIGAIVGGRLGDLAGRTRIYMADLLVYAASLLLVVFAADPAMLLAG